jgi:DNA-binding response OmpR family regulator
VAAPSVVGLRVSVLGGLGVDRGDVEVELGGRKQRAVLALLVAAGGRVVAADRILLGVWGWCELVAAGIVAHVRVEPAGGAG